MLRSSRSRECNPHPTRWQTRGGAVQQTPLTYFLMPHVRLPGDLQMVTSSMRTERNGILACFPDGRRLESHAQRPTSA